MLALDPVFYELMERDPKNWNLRKVQILNAAIEQLAEKGITETSYDSLAKALDIGRSHIAYYFADKESLFLEVIRFVAATAQKITIEALERAPRDQEVEAIVNGAFDWAEQFPMQLRIMLLFYYFSSVRPNYKKFHTQVRLTGRKRLAEAIGGPREKAERLAIGVQGLVTSCLLEASTLDHKGEDIKSARERCLRLVKDLLL